MTISPGIAAAEIQNTQLQPTQSVQSILIELNRQLVILMQQLQDLRAAELTTLVVDPNHVPVAFKDCGRIQSYPDEMDIDLVLSKIAKETPAICLGQAMADNCTSAFITTDDGQFLVQKNNGSCEFGLMGGAEGKKTANFCTAQGLFGTVEGSEDVLKKAASEPGNTISMLFFNYALIGAMLSPDRPGCRTL